MMGLLARVFLESLQRLWPIVCVSPTKWRRMFPDTVDTTRERDVWRTALTAPPRYTGPAADCLQFGLTELARKNPEWPVIFVKQSSGRPVASAVATNPADLYQRVSYTLEVICIATQPELAGALTQFVRNALHTDKTRIIDRTGTADFGFQDSAETAPMQELLPERGGHAWYRLRYQAMLDEMLVDLNASDETANETETHEESADDGFGLQGRVQTIPTPAEGV